MGDQDDRDRTAYVTGLNHRVTKEHIYELFTQAGPIEKVVLIEKDGQKGGGGGGGDKKEGGQRGFTFSLVVFKDRESVPFSIGILNGIELFGQPINIKPRDGSDHGKAIDEIMRLLHTRGQAKGTRRGGEEPPPPTTAGWSRTHPMDVRGMMGPPGGTPFASPLAGMFGGFTPPPPPPPAYFYPGADRQHSYPATRRDRGESWEERGYDRSYGSNSNVSNSNNGASRGGDFRYADRDSRNPGRHHHQQHHQQHQQHQQQQQQQWSSERRNHPPRDDRDYRREYRDPRADDDRQRREPYPGSGRGRGRR